MKKIIVAVLSIFFLINSISYAHSGRTDANGGHNCSKKSIEKGLCTGYHYHNTGSKKNDSTKQKSTLSNNNVKNNKATIKANNKTYEPIDIKVIVNNNFVKLNRQAVSVNNVTLLPLRDIFDALEAKISWDSSEQKIIAERNGSEVTLYVGSKKAYKNGEQIELSQSPIIIDEFTMVPVRIVAELLGATVGWEEKTATITITLD